MGGRAGGCGWPARRGYNYGDLLRSGAPILEPVLLLVRDSRTRDRVEAEVRKRYGADYQVITTGSVKEALGALGQLHDDQRQVALVLADRWLPEATGTELLAQARQFHPAARRVELITWADQASAEPMADSMSEYLIREIESAPNIAVRHRVAVTGGAGQSRLEYLTLTDLESGAAETVDAAALFVLIGAEPRTQWLPHPVRRDQSGFVVTGTDLLEGGRPDEQWPLRRLPMFLESSLPGGHGVSCPGAIRIQLLSYAADQLRW